MIQKNNIKIVVIWISNSIPQSCRLTCWTVPNYLQVLYIKNLTLVTSNFYMLNTNFTLFIQIFLTKNFTHVYSKIFIFSLQPNNVENSKTKVIFFSQMGLHTFIRPCHMFFFKSALLLLLQFWWWVVVMVYMDVLTMLVRDMQIDAVPMRDVKLKCFAFGETSCHWWEILLFSICLLFFPSLHSVLLVGYKDGV